jgi:hypothetical protein
LTAVEHLADLERQNGPEQLADTPQDDTALGILPIRRIFGFNEARNGNKESLIRQQLRSWSEQQVRRQAEQSTSREGNVTAQNDMRVTNSLFLERNSAYDEDEEGDYTNEEIISDKKYNLEPGDAMELLQVVKGGSKNTMLSIYISPLGTQDLFLAEDGRWIAISVVRPKSLPIHGFVDPAMLEPLMPFLPERPIHRPSKNHGMIEDIATFGEIPSEIVAPFTKQLATLREEVLDFRREHVSVMERVHELLAHEERFLVKTIDQATKELFSKPFSELSRGGHIAFFHALELDPLGCQMCKRPDNSFRLILTPKHLVRKFEDVREWTRQYQEAAAQAALGKNVASSLMDNPLKVFIDKARRIILKSRKIRSPTTIGNLGPSTLKNSDRVEEEGMITLSETGETFTESDQMIIEFIWNTYLRTPRVMFNSAAQSIASQILRAIGAYPSLRLEHKIARLLLQELGVLAPWSEIADDDVVLPIPGRRNGFEANRLFQESEQLVRELNIHTPPHMLTMADSMAHLRRESKATEFAYCIDRSSAEILDDAFSIEECDDIPGAHWLHIHITHPSAFIETDHLFAKRAAYFSSSLYTSRQSYPMFPHYLSAAFSLKRNAPCLTLSSLILSTGEVKEVKMTPGKLKEVIRINPKAVDKVLGRRDPEIASLTIGGTHEEAFEENESQVEHAAQHLDVLKKAQQICQARLEHRLVEVPEPLDMAYNDANFDVWVSYAEDTNKFDRSQSRHFVGDPIIYVSSARHARSDRASRRYLVDSLITQLMSVASEIAGLWCRQREIPAIYQASLTQPGFSPSKLSNLERHEKKVEPRHQLSSTPLPHVLINCNQYMRFTSPLRRYTDLIGLWQIDAYLKQEDKSPNRIIGYDNTEELPFSKVQLDEYISENAQTIKDLDRLMVRSKTHWTYLAFFRAFHFKEASLPEVWDLRIERSSYMTAATKLDDSGLRGRLIPFHVNELRVLKSEEGYEKTAMVGQYLPVKIELVDVELPTMYVKAVGPPSDKPTTTQPIRIVANVDSASSQLEQGLEREAEHELGRKSEPFTAGKERNPIRQSRKTNKVGW